MKGTALAPARSTAPVAICAMRLAGCGSSLMSDYTWAYGKYLRKNLKKCSQVLDLAQEIKCWVQCRVHCRVHCTTGKHGLYRLKKKVHTACRISCEMPPVSTAFVHLHVHTEYSLADGIVSTYIILAFDARSSWGLLSPTGEIIMAHSARGFYDLRDFITARRVPALGPASRNAFQALSCGCHTRRCASRSCVAVFEISSY